MLRIEEIVGAMDDEFRYALDALSDDRLAQLAADKPALRRMRPVGVSTAEALDMIAAIQRRRLAAAEKAAAKAAAPKKPRAPRKAKPAPQVEETVADANVDAQPPEPIQPEQTVLEQPIEEQLIVELPVEAPVVVRPDPETEPPPMPVAVKHIHELRPEPEPEQAVVPPSAPAPAKEPPAQMARNHDGRRHGAILLAGTAILVLVLSLL